MSALNWVVAFLVAGVGLLDLIVFSRNGKISMALLGLLCLALAGLNVAVAVTP